MWNKIEDIEDRFLLLSDLGFSVGIEKGFLFKRTLRNGFTYNFTKAFNQEMFSSEDVIPAYDIFINNRKLSSDDIIKSLSTISIFTNEIIKVVTDLDMPVYHRDIVGSSSAIISISYNPKSDNFMTSSFSLGEERFNWKHIQSVIADLIQWKITFRKLIINVDNNFRYVSFYIPSESDNERHKDISTDQSEVVYNELKEKYEITRSSPEILDGFFINPTAFPVTTTELGRTLSALNGGKREWSITNIKHLTDCDFYKIKL